MRIAVVLLLAGCGRVAFDPLVDGGGDAGDAPEITARSSARTVSAGGNKTCVIASTGAAYCWGMNEGGGLGDGTAVFQRATPAAVSGTTTFERIESADGGACGITATRELWCWGRNTNGQLGIGTDTDLLTPQQIAVSDVREVSIGYYSTCVRRGTGTVSCAGRGDGVGDGTGTMTYTFTPVLGLDDAIDITAGEEHHCALRRDGSVACWGQNGRGQLGDGTSTMRTAPAPGPSGPYDDVAAGDYHTCARRLDGAIDCWGAGDMGQLGDGNGVDSATPVRVAGITDAESLAAGAQFTCALRAAGVATCWGEGTDGALGNGAMVSLLAPGANVALPDIVELTARTSNHVCARDAAGDPYCWGFNLYGQIGDGTSNNRRPTPVPVMNVP